MKLNYNAEIPIKSGYKSSHYQEILKQFVASGEAVAEVTNKPKDTNPANVRMYLASLCKRSGYAVKAIRRGNRVFLMREQK